MALESTNAQNSKHKVVHKVTWGGYDIQARMLAEKIQASGKFFSVVYGIPRGGLILATHLSNLLKIEMVMPDKLKDYDPSLVLVCDDVSDSGNTLKPYKDSGYTLATLFSKISTTIVPDHFAVHAADDMWLTFPWEV